ncbi:MAG: UDP-glucose/GDP-mannose dehydrogenase family protein [Thermoleophilia bacterium]
MSRITVIGVGYVGLVTATCLASLGNEITAMDVDESKIDGLREGHVPIYEPGLADLIEENRGRMHFTTDPTEAYRSGEFIFVCVDTPPLYSGDADLSRIWQVIENLPPEDGERILVTKSTVPVGTGAAIKAELAARGYEHIKYCSNPEFLREGSAIGDFLHPDRVVVGADDPDVRRKVSALYEPLGAEIVRTSVASAEMIKYASNAFLATKISFINEIANVCEATGADVRTVAYGMGLDDRIGPHFLQAGIGYGGSCFPKDVSALKQLAGNSGYHFQLLTAVIEVNELQKRRVIGKLKRHLGDELRGKRVVLLGLAFKPNTDDIREASSIVLASRLLAEGAEVVAHDPIAMDNARRLLHGVEFADDAYSALRSANAAVLVTEWPDYIHLDWERAGTEMAGKLVIDGRNALDWETLVGLGFTVEGIGAAPQTPPMGES